MGLILGSLLLGPAGILFGPFLVVLMIGVIQNRKQIELNFKRTAAILTVFSS